MRLLLDTGTLIERNVEIWQSYENTPFCLAAMVRQMVHFAFSSEVERSVLEKLTLPELIAWITEQPLYDQSEHSGCIYDPSYQDALMDLWLAVIRQIDLIRSYRNESAILIGIHFIQWVGFNLLIELETSSFSYSGKLTV